MDRFVDRVAGSSQRGECHPCDLLAAAAGDVLVAGGEVRVPLGGLRGLAQHPAHPGRALLGDVPWRITRSLPRTIGVSPAQAASLRADPNRVMSPTSASRTSAVNGPTPGRPVSTLTRGSDRAR